jgi:glycosyltransferase involved in cell wall biosynthesis
MAAYNASAHIQESIGSVLGQTYSNWELLIVNDGSTDNTADLIHTYHDSRIKYFEQSNNGVSAARNLGLKHMQGDYFCFLDSDDLLTPVSLFCRVQFMEENRHVDLLDGIVEIRDMYMKNLLGTYRPVYYGKVAKEYIRLNDRVFFGPSTFFKRDPEISYHFLEGMTHAEDLLFYTELAWRYDLNYSPLADTVYIYRKSQSSAMSNLSGLEKGYWQFYSAVRQLEKIKWWQKLYLQMKIIKIMFLSYSHNKDIFSAVRVLRYIFFQPKFNKLD